MKMQRLVSLLPLLAPLLGVSLSAFPPNPIQLDDDPEVSSLIVTTTNDVVFFYRVKAIYGSEPGPSNDIEN